MLTNAFPGGRGQAHASVSDSGLWHRERGHFCRFRRPGLWPRVVGALGNRRPEHSTPGPPTSHRAQGCHAVAALTPGSVPRTAVGTAGRSLAWVGLGARPALALTRRGRGQWCALFFLSLQYGAVCSSSPSTSTVHAHMISLGPRRVLARKTVPGSGPAFHGRGPGLGAGSLIKATRLVTVLRRLGCRQRPRFFNVHSSGCRAGSPMR